MLAALYVRILNAFGVTGGPFVVLNGYPTTMHDVAFMSDVYRDVSELPTLCGVRRFTQPTSQAFTINQ